MKFGMLGFTFLILLATLVFGFVFLKRPEPKPRAAAAASPTKAQAQQRSEVEARRRRFIVQYLRLWRATDYAGVRIQAQQGDPLAQRRLYEIYQDCMSYRDTGEATMQTLEKIGESRPNTKRAAERIKASYARLCGANGAGREANPQYYLFWLQHSAKGGDLVSEIRLQQMSKLPMTAEQLRVYLRKAALSGDPNAMMEVSRLFPRLDRAWPDRRLQPAIQGPYAASVWVIAACRAGMDCREGSRIMEASCLSALNCERQDYETMLYADMLPGQQRKYIDALVDSVRAAFVELQSEPAPIAVKPNGAYPNASRSNAPQPKVTNPIVLQPTR